MPARMRRKRNPPLLVGLNAGTTTMENSLVVPLIAGHRDSDYSATQHTHTHTHTHKHTHTHTHTHTSARTRISKVCSKVKQAYMLHYGQKLEITQMSFGRRKNSENMLQLHSGVLLSNQTQWFLEILRPMDDTIKYHAEWGNPIPKEYTGYALTDTWILTQELGIPKIAFTDHMNPKCGLYIPGYMVEQNTYRRNYVAKILRSVWKKGHPEIVPPGNTSHIQSPNADTIPNVTKCMFTGMWYRFHLRGSASTWQIHRWILTAKHWTENGVLEWGVRKQVCRKRRGLWPQRRNSNISQPDPSDLAGTELPSQEYTKMDFWIHMHK